MEQPTENTESADQPVRSRRDRGTTFIELLVAIVLVGTTVIGVLTATRATIISTGVSRDQSRAQQWLQSAIGQLDAVPLAECDLIDDPDGDGIVADYEAVIGLAAPPDGWWGTTATIEIVPPPKVWNGTTFVDYALQPTCFDLAELRQQLLTIRVTSPDGRIVRDLEVIKRDI